MDETTIIVPTSDGIALQVYRWAPTGVARAAVQLQHGLAHPPLDVVEHDGARGVGAQLAAEVLSKV